MFPGLGTHYANMTRGLYQAEPTFRKHVDRCAQLLLPHLGLDFRQVLYAGQRKDALEPAGQAVDLKAMLRRGFDGQDEPPPALRQTSIAQPIIFVVEYALAQLLMEWGLYPQALIGYSLGEYVAACLSGVFSLKDALMVVARRAQMIDDLCSGSMLAVPLGEEDVRPLLTGDLSLAIVNGPVHCVVAGVTGAVEDLEKRLAERGVTGQRVLASHAVHSQMMEPLVEPFCQFMAGITLNPPQLPYPSNVTGDWISQEQATSPAYWAEHMCQTVRFGKGLEVLLQEDKVLLEVGPGHSLGVFVKLHPEYRPASGQVVLPTMPYAYEAPSDEAFLLNTVGRLWLAGLSVDWAGFYAHERRQRLPLPTYPFERQRYWIAPGEPASGDRSRQRALGSRPDIADWFYLPTWKQTPPIQFLARVDRANEGACLVVFLDGSKVGSRLVERLRQEYEVITVSKGTGFTEISHDAYVIHPGQAEGYEVLFQALRALGKVPKVVVHLWSIVHKGDGETGTSPGLHDRAFYSMLYLVQAFGKTYPSAGARIKAVSNGIHRVTGEETIWPENAMLLGPCMVAPQEYANMSCQVIDLALAEPGALSENILVDQLVAEITTACADTLVAYRGGRRWVQTFEPIRLDRQAGPIPLLRDGGVYLIIGGLGGIGLVLAEYLVRAVPTARLVLLGRSDLPSRDAWASWLEEHGEQDVFSIKIGAVQRLTGLGAKVITIGADVASEPQMRTAIQQVRRRFGQIHGIIHCAGIELGGMIALKTAEMAASVLAPRVEGLRVLEAVFEDTKLDFLILCSSINSFRGTVGQVDHCASFAFMDAFAHFYTTGSGTPTISINWSAWREVGLAVNIDVPSLETLRQGILRHSMSPREGIEAFERILGSGLGQVIVSPQDLTVPGENGAPLSRNLDELVQESDVPADDKHSRPVLGTMYVAPRNDVEQEIVDIWQRLLGIEGLGIHDNFVELGGHSLLAVQIASRLNDAFGVEIPLSAFFETPTVAGLATRIRSTQGAQACAHPTADDREVGAI
jgi:acyl transferase domain-containing protein/acyl carrier protein